MGVTCLVAMTNVLSVLKTGFSGNVSVILYLAQVRSAFTIAEEFVLVKSKFSNFPYIQKPSFGSSTWFLSTAGVFSFFMSSIVSTADKFVLP